MQSRPRNWKSVTKVCQQHPHPSSNSIPFGSEIGILRGSRKSENSDRGVRIINTACRPSRLERPACLWSRARIKLRAGRSLWTAFRHEKCWCLMTADCLTGLQPASRSIDQRQCLDFREAYCVLLAFVFLFGVFFAIL